MSALSSVISPFRFEHRLMHNAGMMVVLHQNMALTLPIVAQQSND